MLVGAGSMGELTARQLLSLGVGSVMVTNRTYDRAMEVARDLGGMPVPFDRLGRYLPMADLVIGAASGDEYLLTPAVVEDAMRERRRRPMFLVDLAVPRAFDPRVNQLDGVYLFDIDALEGVIADNRGARAREAAKAETIVEAEVESFWRWFTTLDVVPTIVALREKLEAIRQREVACGLQGVAELDARQREAVERITRGIVNKILHEPVTALRRGEQDGGEPFDLDAARRLFRLGAGSDDPDDDEGA
jgi:glutamyl-tRNA reductase